MTTTIRAEIDAILQQIAADYRARYPEADAFRSRKVAAGMTGAVCRVIRIEDHSTVAQYAARIIDAADDADKLKLRKELRRSRHKIDGELAEDYAAEIAHALPLILKIVALKIKDEGERMKHRDDAEAARNAPRPPKGKHFRDRIAALNAEQR